MVVYLSDCRAGVDARLCKAAHYLTRRNALVAGNIDSHDMGRKIPHDSRKQNYSQDNRFSVSVAVKVERKSAAFDDTHSRPRFSCNPAQPRKVGYVYRRLNPIFAAAADIPQKYFSVHTYIKEAFGKKSVGTDYHVSFYLTRKTYKRHLTDLPADKLQFFNFSRNAEHILRNGFYFKLCPFKAQPV